MKRIAVVSGDPSISPQAHTYAEYRVFAVVGRHNRSIQKVRVELRRTDDRRTCDNATCVVTMTLNPSGSFRVRGTGSHVYAAINRAVERLGVALERRVEQRLPS